MATRPNWKYYSLVFIAVAGWVYEQTSYRGGYWVAVAEQARKHGIWMDQ